MNPAYHVKKEIDKGHIVAVRLSCYVKCVYKRPSRRQHMRYIYYKEGSKYYWSTSGLETYTQGVLLDKRRLGISMDKCTFNNSFQRGETIGEVYSRAELILEYGDTW